MKFSVLAQPVGLLKLMLNLCCTHNIQGRKLYCDFTEYMFNITICQDTCELICFKLALMLNTTNLYSLVPVWLTLTFILSHRVMGHPEILQSLHCKVAWSSSNFRDGWLCKGHDWRSPASMASIDRSSICCCCPVVFVQNWELLWDSHVQKQIFTKSCTLMILKCSQNSLAVFPNCIQLGGC